MKQPILNVLMATVAFTLLTACGGYQASSSSSSSPKQSGQPLESDRSYSSSASDDDVIVHPPSPPVTPPAPVTPPPVTSTPPPAPEPAIVMSKGTWTYSQVGEYHRFEGLPSVEVCVATCKSFGRAGYCSWLPIIVVGQANPTVCAFAYGPAVFHVAYRDAYNGYIP